MPATKVDGDSNIAPPQQTEAELAALEFEMAMLGDELCEFVDRFARGPHEWTAELVHCKILPEAVREVVAKVKAARERLAKARIVSLEIFR